jgi:Reverse transcriptase (RNA-dependent DNA polymerase)/Endonuclease-reverse transcriptase
MFWNCHGINNLYDVSVDDYDIFLNHSIIGLCETWSMNDIKPPLFLNSYKIICSKAIKNKTKGRASGGLAILYDTNSGINDFEILISCDMWLIIKFKSILSKDDIIVCITYISPLKDYSVCMDLFQDTLTDILAQNPDSFILIGGDFNARIGNIGFCDKSLHDNDSIQEFRNSCDTSINNKGNLLISTMENLGFCLLNGRCVGDMYGEYTFVDDRGQSVLDLVWVNYRTINNIKTFSVGDQFLSDHRMCIVCTHWKLNVGMSSQVTIHPSKQPKVPSNKLKWNHDSKELYTHILNSTAGNYLPPVESHNTIQYNILNSSSTTEYSDPLMYYKFILKSIRHAAQNSNMIVYFSGKHRKYPNKLWFDHTCVMLNRRRRQLLRVCKREGFTDQNLINYLNAKCEYKANVTSNKFKHRQEVMENLAKCNHSKIFWATANKFRGRSQCHPVSISKQSWEDFYDKELQGERETLVQYSSVGDEYFDADFSIGELNKVLSNISNNKAPGPDGIPNEFYKNMPGVWKNHLVNLYNNTLHTEQVPTQWSEIETVTLFKKGDRSQPANYRGISLLNVILKVFTQLILYRIHEWSESVLPEHQAGFRTRRSCVDHVFTLSSVVNLSIQKKGKKLYVAFIDFQRAFDSVSHNKLWQQLIDLGLSAKLVRILQKIYFFARMKVRTADGYTKLFEVIKGVLQGEILSPSLFSIFIQDIENIFVENNVRGVCIDHIHELHLLAYADDLVLLADSPRNLQDKLNLLFQYCENKKLCVNTSKTQCMVFHRGSISKKLPEFYYGTSKLQTVTTYTYLGINFTSSGLFTTAVSNLSKKANSSIATVWGILTNSKMKNWESRMKIFNSISMSVLLYSSSVWSPRFLQEIEKFRIAFLKKLLKLPKCTPAYLVRLETGEDNLEYKMMIFCIRLWIKILKMPDERLPKICLKALIARDNHPNNVLKYNWATQIRMWLAKYNYEHLWVDQDPEKISENLNNIVELVKSVNFYRDIQSANKSSYNLYYKNFNHSYMGQEYLRYNVSIDKLRVICQIRLMSVYFCRVISHNIKYDLDPKCVCTICDLLECESLYHFFINCKIYKGYRVNLLKHNNYLNLGDVTSENFHEILEIKNQIHLFNMYNFVTRSFRERSWIINE